MPKLRLLVAVFDLELMQEDLPYLRAAISDIAGREHVLFHNHDGERYRQNYSLIQYKIIRRKAALVCVDSGVDEVQHFFNNFKGKVRINKSTREFGIENLSVNQFNMAVWDHKFIYRIKNWLPFNEDNYQKYHQLQYLTQKTEFLENIIKSNLLALASGIGWSVDKEINAKILEYSGKKILPVKGVKKDAFSLEFESNIFLPNYIGLGRHTSLGFGSVKEIIKNKNEPLR